MSRTRRGRAPVFVCTGMLALLVLPVLVGARYDSFPLSTYPMFAGARPEVVPVSTVVAVGPADAGSGAAVRRLSSELIGGTDEPMLAAETVVRAIGRGEADTLCTEIARRAASSEYAGSELEVVTEAYDTIAWFDGHRAPASRTVHARCVVP